MKTTHQSIVKFSALAVCGFLLASCGGVASSGSTAKSAASSQAASTSASSNPFINPYSSTSGSTSKSSSSSSSSSHVIQAYTLANIKEAKEYLCEAEDCDTSGCTLQAGCAGFIEDPDASLLPATSGGECIACIVGPSTLAFKFECNAVCDITFYTVCSKYENPWDLDANVSYSVDTNAAFVTGFTAFGHTDSNQWYNWKTIKLGSMSNVSEGTHVFNMSIQSGAGFPNTDCFKLEVTKYNGVSAPISSSTSTSTSASASSAGASSSAA